MHLVWSPVEDILKMNLFSGTDPLQDSFSGPYICQIQSCWEEARLRPPKRICETICRVYVRASLDISDPSMIMRVATLFHQEEPPSGPP